MRSAGVPRVRRRLREVSHQCVNAGNVLTGGHGKGCNEADDAFTLLRRRFHHFTFYGFMPALAVTVVATGYHYVAGWEAPWPALSLPVMLGTLGGIGSFIGPAGLLWSICRRCYWRCAPEPHGSRLYSCCCSNQLCRAGVAGRQRHQRNGHTAGAHLGVVMAFFCPSLRKIRPRIFAARPYSNGQLKRQNMRGYRAIRPANIFYP